MFCPSKLNDSHNSREKIVPKTFCKTMEKKTVNKEHKAKGLKSCIKPVQVQRREKSDNFFFQC